MIWLGLRRAQRHAALLLTTVLAASIPSCGSKQENQDFPYCYSYGDSCSCRANPWDDASNAVPTCGTQWAFCCQWKMACECYAASADGVAHNGGTCINTDPDNPSPGTVVPTCGPGGGGGPIGGGQCTNEEPHTVYASCDTDDDCYTGYCNDSCNPGPCCEVATDSVRDDGRSYDCETDADCAAVAPDFVARGGVASCVHPGSTMEHHICTFYCDAP